MPLSDRADYDGEFFLANANIALKTRQESPWGKSIPEEIFLHHVLPCRDGAENLDSFRMAYYDEIQRRVKGMDATAAALEINHWCHEKVTGRPGFNMPATAMSIILSAHGTCGARSHVTVAALRTAGIPARSVWTKSFDHQWVEVWIDGKWHYMEACEPEPVLDRAWFTEAASRAMWIGTRLFGAKYGHEKATAGYKHYCIINNLSQYAVTKTITVKVLDANNLPVKEALVEYLIYGDGGVSPIAQVPTDEAGISQFETGLGDLLIWARKGDDFNFGKICVKDTDRLELTLKRKPADSGFQELDFRIPPGRTPGRGPAAELIAANTKRIDEENAIRQAYVNSWMKPEEAARLAKELGADPNTIKAIISRSMGNYRAIAAFLTHTPASDRPLAIGLLRFALARTTTEEVLADHLTNVVRFENTHGAYDYELYSRYVLNPTIIGEWSVAWRKCLYESLPADFRQDARNDPSILIRYVKNSVILDDDEIRAREGYRRGIWPPISPKGVSELKVADSFSRDIYFVALCRSLGIPARIWGPWPRDDHRPQFYFNRDWHDVWFADRNEAEPANGFIRFASDEKDPAPKYDSEFTIARFENGHYEALSIRVDFQNEVALPPGHYMLVTGNKANDSKVLATLSFFELKPNEHKGLDIKVRRWTRHTTGVDLYIAARSGDLATVERLTQEEAEVDRKDEWGWTALYWAMRGNQKEVAEFLIDKGADVNIKGQDGETLLYLAIKHNQKELVEVLIAKGADVNDKDNWSWTALHSAAGNGKKDMVELLIARGANVNARDGGNRTPLWYAQDEGHSEIVELLRKHGAKE